jgi:conjugal transfer pilus assembly protein TraF
VLLAMLKRPNALIIPLLLVIAGETYGDAFFDVSDGRAHYDTGIEEPFFADKERGWFWYEESPPPIPPEAEEPRLEPAISINNIKPQTPSKKVEKPLSSEWFRIHMQSYRDAAIDNPTKENVSTYMYLQRVMLDKASRFSDMTNLVTMSDSILDENARRPIASFGSTAMDERSRDGVNQAAKKLAKTAGLWFFYSSTCQYCVKEASVLTGIAHAHGFKVMPIALDGAPLPNGLYPDFVTDKGQSSKLGVTATPDIFLVNPNHPNSVVHLGQGLIAGDDLVKRAITLAHESGWLNETEYRDTLKINPVSVTTEVINTVDEKTINNPQQFVQTIRNNLKNQIR